MARRKKEGKKKMIQEVLKTIRLLFEVLLEYYRSGPELTAKKTKEKVKLSIRLYFKGFVFLTLFAILPPISLLIIGIIGGWRWLSALSGILWAMLAFLLLVWSTPIGILIESLISGIKGSGQRYIRWALGVIVVGLCISLYASIVPIKANLPMFFVLIVGSMILGILNAWIFSRKVITTVVSIIFVLLTLSFFFPMSFETLREKIREIDVSTAEPERLYITQDSIERGKIKFFRPDGKPKVWYYRTKDGKFELFNRKGYHPIYNKEKLKPVTSEVISQIENHFKAEAERRIQEERRRQEEAERLARKQAEQQREASLNRYLLSRSFISRPEFLEVAILIIDENNRVNHDMTQKIASVIKTKGVNVTTSLFTGHFVSDGIFEKIFKGDAVEVKRLELSKHSDYIIFGKESVNFTENPDMQNMITAHGVIKLNIISAETGTIEDSFTVSEVGAGFSRATAEDLLKQRILKKLAEKEWNVIRKRKV